MINDKADNFQYINQKSSRRISRINPPEMAKGNVGTCDRRKEEAERGRNDEIRCHMHVPEVKNFSESKRHLEIQYFCCLLYILLDFLRFMFFPISQNSQNYR